MSLTTERGPNVTGAGYCPNCHWSIEVHPMSVVDGDVDRCPDQPISRGRDAEFFNNRQESGLVLQKTDRN